MAKKKVPQESNLFDFTEAEISAMTPAEKAEWENIREQERLDVVPCPDCGEWMGHDGDRCPCARKEIHDYQRDR